MNKLINGGNIFSIDDFIMAGWRYTPKKDT